MRFRKEIEVRAELTFEFINGMEQVLSNGGFSDLNRG